MVRLGKVPYVFSIWPSSRSRRHAVAASEHQAVRRLSPELGLPAVDYLWKPPDDARQICPSYNSAKKVHDKLVNTK
jgi:hypothetical protein